MVSEAPSINLHADLQDYVYHGPLKPYLRLGQDDRVSLVAIGKGPNNEAIRVSAEGKMTPEISQEGPEFFFSCLRDWQLDNDQTVEGAEIAEEQLLPSIDVKTLETPQPAEVVAINNEIPDGSLPVITSAVEKVLRAADMAIASDALPEHELDDLDVHLKSLRSSTYDLSAPSSAAINAHMSEIIHLLKQTHLGEVVLQGEALKLPDEDQQSLVSAAEMLLHAPETLTNPNEDERISGIQRIITYVENLSRSIGAKLGEQLGDSSLLVSVAAFDGIWGFGDRVLPAAWRLFASGADAVHLAFQSSPVGTLISSAVAVLMTQAVVRTRSQL